ncbi:hypothetical protein ES703_65227 [subsurface metagenome]
MALVKYGGGIIQMSGSVAGNTFSRNRYGNYVRARTKPVNPNTARQIAVKAAMAFLADRWSQILTEAQRTAWNLYGSSVDMTNGLGETINLSGYNHYMRSNMIRKQAGVGIIDAGPTIFEIPAQDPTFAIVADESNQDILYTFNNALAWANEVGGYLFKFQGSPQNPQRNFFGGPWRYHGKIVGAGSPPSSPDTQVDPPFVVTELQRQWCYGRIGRADGRLSQPFTADTFCVA